MFSPNIWNIFVSNYELVLKDLGRKTFMYPLDAANGFTSTSQHDSGVVKISLPLCFRRQTRQTHYLSHHNHLIQYAANLDSLLIAVYSSPVGLLLLLHVASFTVCPAQL